MADPTPKNGNKTRDLRETGGTPVLLRRITPDPVALFFVEQYFPRSSAVVLFVPTDGVEYELSIAGATIFVRLAGEQVVRQGREELRRERFQCFGKLSVGQAVSFQRAGERGLVGVGLCYGSFQGYFAQRGQQHRSQELMVDDGVEGFPEAAARDLPLEFTIADGNLIRENPFPGGVKSAFQMVFVEPAITKFLQMIPSLRNNPADKVRQITAGLVGWAEQFARAVFFSGQEIGGQYPGCSLAVERSCHVHQ